MRSSLPSLPGSAGPRTTGARLGLVLLLCVLVAAIGAACGSSSNGSAFVPKNDASTGGTSDGSSGGSGSSSGSGEGGPVLFGDSALEDANGPLVIAPTNKTIDVTFGQQTPTVAFTATVNGQTVPAAFAIDLGQIGSINSSTGVMTPTGNVGGKANVTATYAGKTATTPVTVVLHLVDNGAPPLPDGGTADAGAGGIGGVGGSGTGGPVSSSTQTTLQGTPTTDPGVSMLYPYDQTVWPRGLLAPLLQWSAPSGHSYDAVYVHLQEQGFEYQGYFAANAATFVNTLVPQAAWDTLGYSNQGDPVTVTLVFSSGGTAYGPLTETWKFAQGKLTGTVYYNSYGTALVTNYCSGVSWQSGQFCFGGATLGIKHGATSPVLVAGTNGSNPQCRVCHSVAAQGSTLITQHGDDYDVSSSYALTGGLPPPETPMTGKFQFSAVSPDGTFLFTNTGPLPAINPPSTSGLFSVPAGTAIAATGLAAGFAAATPVFSPDGKHIAFNDYSKDKVSLSSIDFDPAGKAFSNYQVLHTPSPGPDLFPAFLPTNDAVVFEVETAPPSPVEFGATRDGARGELWWVDLKTHTAAPLAKLNGAGYLPTGGTNHAADATLNYEPTVNPVASGGYAWVVFTSRRMYGNVATQDPFLSDPRNYNPALSATTKKLWVAAVDLNATPGTDPSHPAFYLPAQELLAGNSRGYWVVDPCQADGTTCETGDECCGGYCEDVDGGFVCSSQPPPTCASIGDKCTTNADCCGASQGIECIDGHCSQPTPQ